MELIDSLKKIANQLDQLGYFEDADDVDLMIEAVIEASLTKSANQVVVTVKEDPKQNQWIAQSSDAAFSFSSPIYQDEAARTAQNKAPGIQAMRAGLAKEVAAYSKSHPGVRVIVQPTTFAPIPVPSPRQRPQRQPIEFTMGPATVTNVTKQP